MALIKIKKNFFRNTVNSIFALVCIFSSMQGIAAEFVYISDSLRVGVRSEPVNSVPPIGVVLTGMKLEVLESQDGYLKIKTDKNLTGWIKDIYVTKTPPAMIQLNKLKSKYDKLKSEVSKGGETTDILEKANVALNEQIDELKQQRREWQRERAGMLASQHSDSSVFWYIIIVVLMGISFGAGILWHRNLVMKRLGGLRF